MFLKSSTINCYHTDLQISGNVISYGNSFIQAKNISLIAVSRPPSSNLWIGSLIMMIIGLFLVCFYKINKEISQLGLLGIATAVVLMICFLVAENRKGY